jgi:hypothetical protein
MAVIPIELVRNVKETLRAFSPLKLGEIREGMRLHRDLAIDQENDLKALAAPFQRIARGFNDDAIVTRKECTELETVKDCVTLVSSKAGFSEGAQ